MNENDYIAEYVREKYPTILGLNYAFWKFKRLMAQTASDIINVFRQIPPEEIRKAIQESEEENERISINTDI